MKIIINENQRGFLFKNGKFIKLLHSGVHHFFNPSYTVEKVSINDELALNDVNLELLLKDPAVVESTSIIDIDDQCIALHYIDGRFTKVLYKGKHAFWNIFNSHTFEVFSIKSIDIPETFPKHLLPFMPLCLVQQIQVQSFEKAICYVDNKFDRLLDEGNHFFFKNGTKVQTKIVDTRLLQMDINGQELLSLDKVTLRINFVCKYKITDYIKIFNEVEDYKNQLHITLQMALRDYVAKYRLDEILENKQEISLLVLNTLKERQNDYYIEIFEAGIKDIILPGEIRDIMNTVLIAEKKAQANVITRREEVASTRSLLNTAKLMDENATLYKLKELEYMEKICENVGNITVSGGNGILSELTKIMKGNTSYD